MDLLLRANINGKACEENLSGIFRKSSPLSLHFEEAKAGGLQARKRYVEQFNKFPKMQEAAEKGLLGRVLYVGESKTLREVVESRFSGMEALVTPEDLSVNLSEGMSPRLAETFPGMRGLEAGCIIFPQDIVIWPSFFSSEIARSDFDALAVIKYHEMQHVIDLSTVEGSLGAAGDGQHVLRLVAEIRAEHAAIKGALEEGLQVSKEFLLDHFWNYLWNSKEFERSDASEAARNAVGELSGLKLEKRWRGATSEPVIEYVLKFRSGDSRGRVEMVADAKSEPGWSEVFRR